MWHFGELHYKSVKYSLNPMDVDCGFWWGGEAYSVDR